MNKANLENANLLNLNDVPGTANILSVAVQRASRLLKADLHKVLLSNSDLGLVDFRVLRYLDKVGAAAQKELVQGTLMEQAQVSRSLSSLEKRNMIKSGIFPNDRRVRLFSMLPRGRAAFEAVHPKVAQHNRGLTEHLSDDVQSQVLRILQDLVIRSAHSAKSFEKS